MHDNLLTKCPHCGTTFRLTQSQLDIAGGAVRCGSCYQVFHAAEHVVKTSVVEERRTVTKAPDPIEEAFDLKSDKGMDPYDTKDLKLDADDNDLFAEEYRASMDKESSISDFGYRDRRSNPKSDTIVDESWAEELLRELGEDDFDDDDDEPDNAAKGNAFRSQPTIVSDSNALNLDDEPPRKKSKPKPNKGNDLSDTFKNLGTFGSDDPFAIPDLDDEPGFNQQQPNVDESWAKSMLDELEEESTPRKNTPSSLTLVAASEPEDHNPFAAKEVSNTRDEVLARLRQNQLREKELARSKAKNKTKANNQGLRNEETEDFFRLLDNEPSATGGGRLADEHGLMDPVGYDEEDLTTEHLYPDSNDVVNQQIRYSAQEYFDEKSHSQRTGSKALTVFGCLLLLLLLAAQYCYFQFDELARSPDLRPTMEKVCELIGCKLPGQQDISKLVATNLVVRSHPYEKNALVIDVIIKNLANFEQPYPIVQLDFEDMEGNAVASRRFEPKEYIGDKTLPLDRMPQNTPIHLTMEIKDPGRNAVNYQLLLLPKNRAG